MSGTVNDWFDEWVLYHARVFGMDRDQEYATFASWRKMFLGAGFTREELFEATEWLAVNDPPAFRDGHLRRLQQRIRGRRSDTLIRPHEVESYPDCRDCGGTGLICGLPDLRTVSGGEWHGHATCAVVCPCGWGARVCLRQQSAEDRHRIMVLAVYEQHNPAWRQQLAIRREYELARVEAHAASRGADRLFGPLMAKLQQKEQA
jgi:hypothetical protein